MDDDRKEFWKRRNPFYGLFDEFDRIDEMMDAMMKNTFKGLEPGKPVSYGFSMKIGPDGKPQVREFGNLQPTQEKIQVRDEREPLVDVINRDDEYDIQAELPGVEKENIDIRATPKHVTVNVPGKFHKEIGLEEGVDADNVTSHYKNGVLTITLKKLAPKKPEGKKVKVN
jgi:HSP20 family protein